MRKFVILIAIACISGAVSAGAHAMLDHTEPRVGATVKVAPRQVTLWFTESLERAFSSIDVTDAAGARVDTGRSAVDASDRHVLRVGVKPLPPGAYHVHWRVLSVDTHTSEGNFSFHVGQ